MVTKNPYTRTLAVLSIIGVSTALQPPAQSWYFSPDHPTYSLFINTHDDQGARPSVGSPEWMGRYPPSLLDSSDMPALWLQTYHKAKADGGIPSLDPAATTGGNPTYGSLDPMSPDICSATYKCRTPGSLWDAPSGVVAISFDDGPTSASPKMYNFLKKNNQTATFFMIGVNILNNLDTFQSAVDGGHDIASHTWTHPYMTTLSDLEVVAQLGWTSQIIYDLTAASSNGAGRIPRFWRPPYGDIDVRVLAIGRSVFGLTPVVWNRDSEDWSISVGATTQSAVEDQLSQWYSNNDPKTDQGLVVLEHVLTPTTVQVFIDTYPLINRSGLKPLSLVRALGNPTQKIHQVDVTMLMNGTEDSHSHLWQASQAQKAFVLTPHGFELIAHDSTSP